MSLLSDYDNNDQLDIRDVRIYVSWWTRVREAGLFDASPTEIKASFPVPDIPNTQERVTQFYEDDFWEAVITVAKLPLTYGSDFDLDAENTITDARIYLCWWRIKNDSILFSGTSNAGDFPEPTVINVQAKYDKFLSDGFWNEAVQVIYLPDLGICEVTLDDAQWIWWDECTEAWIIGTVAAGDVTVWYSSDQDPAKDPADLLNRTWFEIEGDAPSPVLVSDGTYFIEQAAGTPVVNSIYEEDGVYNDTALFRARPARITESGDIRILESGDYRIVEE